MKIINLKQKYVFISSCQDVSTNFVIKVEPLGQIWLLNCSEGCQHILTRKRVKISQITKIIITDLKIDNINGLLGLLSTLNLNTRIENIDIYGPRGLADYIFLGRKYSQTNFHYVLSIYNFETSIIAHSSFYRIYAFKALSSMFLYNYSIVISEKPGRFDVLKAINYQVPLGPLYGYLKYGKDFILPDGTMIYGNSFINTYYLGNKVSFMPDCVERQIIESCKYGVIVFYW